MKLRILSVGHKMPAWVQTGTDEYTKRIQPMISTDIIEIAPAKRTKNPSPAEIEKYKSQEGQAILSDGADIALVIGGADGVSADVLTQADFKWSLSDLTLPHPLVRVVLIEQLYRAMSIINNHPYHRA